MESCLVKNLREIEFKKSPLAMLPLLRNLTANNLIKVTHDNEQFYFLMDAHSLYKTPLKDEDPAFSKAILRIPKDDKLGLSVFSFPETREVKPSEIGRLLDQGLLDPAKKKSALFKRQNTKVVESYFTALGWRFKMVSHSAQKKSGKSNKRLNGLY